MPSRYGEPTRAQRAEMERYVIGYPCLLDQHADCGRRIIVDRRASPDDWQDCRCACHREQVAREGPMTNNRAFVRDGGLNPSFGDALARKRGLIRPDEQVRGGRIIRPSQFRDRH